MTRRLFQSDPNPPDAGPEVLRRAGSTAPHHLNRTSCACASEAAAAAPVITAGRTSLATLLSAHILRDGELVILVLRPSLWFILLSSLWFIAVALLFMIAGKVFDARLPGPSRAYVELGVMAIACRIIWATLQWTGRLYILTDMRILSLSGVFNINVFDCPLRKVARTRLLRTVPEQALTVGTIEIVPQDDTAPFGLWQNVSRPRQVHEQIIATLRRAKQGLGVG